MKAAIEGIYSDGKIIPNEKISYKGSAKVLIVFLDDIKDNKMERLLGTFGSWEDDRTSERIVSDIYDSRASRKEDISL